jgi:hypothetical protein
MFWPEAASGNQNGDFRIICQFTRTLEASNGVDIRVIHDLKGIGPRGIMQDRDETARKKA